MYKSSLYITVYVYRNFYGDLSGRFSQFAMLQRRGNRLTVSNVVKEPGAKVSTNVLFK